MRHRKKVLKTKHGQELDETEYLMSSEANRKNLDESIAQLNAGKGIKVLLTEIWNLKN